MRVLNQKYIQYPVTVFLLLIFTISVVWCDDADCHDPKSTSSQSMNNTIIEQESMNQNSSVSCCIDDCSCLCHISVTVQYALITDQIFHFELLDLNVRTKIPSAPARLIYHPPIFP